ncbi:MAG: carbohydrate ABC transporter permease [Clostridiaceae bacterium]|nr:carbohydrate ABC transporter permease [Clostridiaceae bacterium]
MKSWDIKLFNIIAYTIVGLITLLCIVPFAFIVSGSFSQNNLIVKYGYALWPRGYSLDAYKYLMQNPISLLRPFTLSVFVTIVTAAGSLFLISITAYVLARDTFRYKNQFAFFFYFTTLFSGGLIPFYILMVRYLHLRNSILALILPSLFNVFFLLMMRSFIKGSVPSSVLDSAMIDGANEFEIYLRIVLPLMKPALASIGLFEMLGMWNNWSNTMLYISDSKLFTLQYLLYKILTFSNAAFNDMSLVSNTTISPPTETVKMAMAVLVNTPILLVYPFLQKFFVKGITIGAVKG